jgi:hypothetical protein
MLAKTRLKLIRNTRTMCGLTNVTVIGKKINKILLYTSKFSFSATVCIPPSCNFYLTLFEAIHWAFGSGGI